MKAIPDRIAREISFLSWRLRNWRYCRLFLKYRMFTMIPEHIYVNNLLLVKKYQNIPGAVVECGVWKGGMIAGMAEILGNGRKYFLFDSFQGLPPAREIDGEAALRYQSDKASHWYFNNCLTDKSFAEEAMRLSGATHVSINGGWFSDTLRDWPSSTPIAVLRLDSDWYDSTMTCLISLFNHVAPGGIIILDDYTTWDGFSRAVHDFLSSHGYCEKISQFKDTVSYIIKET